MNNSEARKREAERTASAVPLVPSAGVLSAGDRERIARLLGMCGFTENVNDGSMCACGLPALNHDRIAVRVVCGDHPELLSAITNLLAAHVTAAKAEAWDEGYASGHSNAMRRMSDEPNAPTTPNPYQTGDPR